MKITCQSCQSKYTVSDEKVQGKTVKIKCRKCGATILVNSGGVTTSGGAVADPLSVSTGPTADGGASYMVNVADGDQRTMSLGDIVTAYQSSVVTADTYVWADGMADWTPLGQVEAIVSALNAPAPAAAAPSSPPAAAEPEPRAAARRDPGRGARDLFGGKAESDVATSAPAFNGSPAAAKPAAAAPGHREENSMLFSLSALTAKVGSSSPAGTPVPSPRVSTAKDKEDSGIIDLKALAAAANSPSAAPAVNMLPDIGLFPLGAPTAAVAAPPVVAPATPKEKSKMPLFIGFGAVVALGAIVGAFMLGKGGGAAATQPTAAATASAAPTETAAVTATAAPTETAVASAAPTTSASAQPLAKGGGRYVPKGGAAAGGAAKGGAAAGGGTPPPPPPPKGKGNCGCAAGDLMCAMRCSAH